MNSFSYFIPFPLNGSGFLNDLMFAATAPNFSLFELDNFIVNKVQVGESLTYTGIGVYRPCLFSPYNQSVGPLRPILNSAIQGKQVTGQLFKGRWHDIGTPDRFYALNNSLNSA